MFGLFALTLSAQEAPDRTKPPQAGPPAALKLPAIQKQRLSNGLPVWIVETHEVPVAQINLVVQSGTANDPPGKFGVASLTAVMLEEGAGGRSALEIADAVDYLGADLGATSAIDSSAVRLHVPVARLVEALPIMADVALRPTFLKDGSNGSASSVSPRFRGATIRRRFRPSPSRASSTARPTATARRSRARRRPSRRSPPMISARSTRRRSARRTRR
jgi:hypothetical protein